MTLVLIAGALYLIGLPIVFRLLCFAHTKLVIERKAQKMPRNRAAQAALPRPIWPKIKERIGFTFKDTRAMNEKKEGGITNKKAFLLIWLTGLLVATGATFMERYALASVSIILFIAAVAFALKKADPVIKKREAMFQKMFEIGRATLGLSSEHAQQPQAVIQVLEWRDILKPTKVRFQVPPTFSADSEETFQRQFNQVFGVETTWVPLIDPEQKIFGWDYEQGIVTLKETPPLPQMAPWSEHYVLDPSVAWSFFPIGLGVENGIELTNPKTGEVENVLGFDVAGEQASLSKKLGKYCSPTITTSPMALVAGGTGGGKSLSLDTPIRIILREKYDPTESVSE